MHFFHVSAGKSSSYTTMYLEEHNVVRSLRSGFCVYDSRGFDYGCVDEALEELSNWMSQGVHHNQLCSRPGDRAFSEDEAEFCPSRSSSKFMKRRVNCVMVVVNIAEVHKAMKAGNFEPLGATKELFLAPALRKCSESLASVALFSQIVLEHLKFFGQSGGCLLWLQMRVPS